MISLLEAISPTANALLNSAGELGFHVIGYAWHDPLLGDLEDSSVMIACDAQAAIAHLKSIKPHLTRIWVVQRA